MKLFIVVIVVCIQKLQEGKTIMFDHEQQCILHVRISGFAIRADFALLSDCICPGHVVTYECTAVGGGTTVWQGSAFSCRSRAISLRHSQFNGSGAIVGVCNDGAIMAREIMSINSSFTSQLKVTISESVIGENIECVHDNVGTITVIGTDTVTINTGTIYFVRNYS